ncbi:MAG: hypothetical protein ACLFTR_02610 [Candidatus Woesearchaeota archaeon]
MYEAQSVIIGRKKSGDDSYSVLINLFAADDPHLSTDSPLQSFEYCDKTLVVEKSERFMFLPEGNDVVINSISGVEIIEEDDTVTLAVHKKQ